MGVAYPADRKPRSVRLSLLVLAVALSTWLVPSVVRASVVGNVADVAGTPITRQAFDHWMIVAATAGARPDQPVIVPIDPPKFTACITRLREKLPHRRHDSDQTLRNECDHLFGSLRNQVLDFLVKGHWVEDRAFTDRIIFTASQVRRRFDTDRREQFRTRAQFKAFLRASRQTIADMLFRIRVDMTYDALLKKEHLTPTALIAELVRLFEPRTTCVRYYLMSDCSRA